MAITKQQFLEGKEFIFKGSNYKLSDEKNAIHRVYRHYDGTILMNSSEANVDKIGTKTVSTYTFVFGKPINQKLRFEDMDLYDGGDE